MIQFPKDMLNGNAQFVRLIIFKGKYLQFHGYMGKHWLNVNTFTTHYARCIFGFYISI